MDTCFTHAPSELFQVQPVWTPASLPAFDGVEVVSLQEVASDRDHGYMPAAVDAPGVRLSAEEVLQVRSGLQSLPVGRTLRCHRPLVGARLLRDQKLVAQLSICWRCNNLFGWVGEQPVHYAFDRASVGARRLNVLLNQAVGAFA
jgi:hypothetical protein